MRETPDLEAFLQAVRDYVGPYTGQFNYNEMLFAFSDKRRFYPLADLIEEFHKIEGADVLSSGCGFGGNLVAYYDHGARMVVGVEVDPHFARLAGIRVDPLVLTSLVRYDGDRLPFTDESFDIVDSVQVLEHVDNPRLYLDEINRVMRPGGVCYIEFPNRLYPFEQHTRIPLVNWLPKPMGDALSTFLAGLPFMSPERSSRLKTVESISLRNISLLAFYRLISPLDFDVQYLPPFHQVLARLSRVRPLRLILPNTTTRLVLRKKPLAVTPSQGKRAL